MHVNCVTGRAYEEVHTALMTNGQWCSQSGCDGLLVRLIRKPIFSCSCHDLDSEMEAKYVRTNGGLHFRRHEVRPNFKCRKIVADLIHHQDGLFLRETELLSLDAVAEGGGL